MTRMRLKCFKPGMFALCLVVGLAALHKVSWLHPSQAQSAAAGTRPSPLLLQPSLAALSTVPPSPLAASVAHANALIQPSPAAFRASEVRGIWIHTYAPFNWDAAMQKIANAGFNCVFVRAARGINAIYPSKFLARDAWATSGDELRRAVEAAHRHGLKFHAWVVCFNAGATSTTQGAAVRAFGERMAREDRVVRDVDGKQGPHLNPADPRNQALVVNVCREIVNNYPVDGVQLDYIRYPDAPTYDYDYGSTSRRRFEAALGRKVSNWPAQAFSGSLKRQYEDWERDQITGIVRRVRSVTQSAPPLPGRKQVLLSAALWRQWRHNRATIKQDWVNWARLGLLDFAVPMNYKTDDAVFRQSLHEEVAQVGGQVPLVAGIGNWQLSASQLLRQITIARREGADGYCLFAYNAANLNAQLAALKAGPQRLASPFDLAPRLQWSVRGGIVRRDDARVFTMGQQTEIGCSISGEGGGYIAPDDAALQNMADGSLRFIVENRNETLPQWKIPVPHGRWRIIFRGRTDETGIETSFTAHGPIIEGVAPLFAQRLAARDLPPVVPSRLGKRVAVFMDGVGASGILATLYNTPSVNAVPLYRLWPAHLAQAQVVIVPHPNDVALFSPSVEKSLRAWVSRGGHLVLTHDAVGFRWGARLFPEIGVGVALSKNSQLRIEPGHGLTPGTLRHAYADHVVIKPGAAQVLVREWNTNASKGAPVIVRGRFGRGTVTLMGTLTGYVPPGGSPSSPENQLLRELLKTL